MQLIKKNDPKTNLLCWQQFLKGNGAALECLLENHFRSLYQYGTKLLADKTFIVDCIQDLFLQLWNRRHSLQHEVTVKPYLFTSLRRRKHRAAQPQKKFISNTKAIEAPYEVINRQVVIYGKGCNF